ncbi:PSD1 and planctomycete cytochrome C domain-containing protein [Limnoglobus roseus]|uniref:Cytochrome c domain-containing protein n=1 Tax=Limnoglobus roseus TaxID=2598579 RepID=A0A5C1APN2_9BACT|nr:PSD1 and planctomycete cytochrome C domain-containing protein [Limnoglobus roseus]QEL19174.1 hypothetical protein PX52LOC_06232 [Limnoglobus roseus]
MRTTQFVIAVLILTAASARAADPPKPSAEGVAFFEKSIRPVLTEQCYKCHSTQAEKVKGGLLLDTRDGLLKGGNSGPAVVPGNPAKSLLVKSLHASDKVAQMPPKEKLPAGVIADFDKWVKMGAPDPRDGVSAKVYDPAKAKNWWAYQPVQRLPVPVVKDAAWPRGDVDRFVLAGLEAKGIKPVADADKATLLRRVYFDLVGLPPPPQAVADFLADTSPTAFEKVVDKLLQQPQFGERWGRHWLDVARYAESTGKDLNVSFPNAWRYRDYVIAAFNKDKPYDQFVREQIAGDLLPASDDRQRAERLVATGFLAIGPKGLGALTPRQFELDLADELVDATTTAFLGVTVACARCHDHKFDPVTQRDYTALAGVFLSTEVRYGTLAGPKNNQERSLISLPAGAAMPAVKPSITKAERDDLKKQLTDATKRYDDLMANRAPPGKGKEGGSNAQRFIQIQIALGKKADLENQLNSFDESGKAKAFCMGVQDRPAGKPRPDRMLPTKVVEIKGSSGIRPPSGFELIADSPLFARGEMNEPGDRVPRGFPAALLKADIAPAATKTSGRKEFAEWLTNPKNPLTARVMSNRTWHWLFGQGVVASVDNFGTMGVPPAYQPLLDHLATRLVENKWSVKATIREIVLSRTYQLASTHDEVSFNADPQNALVWRQSKRRLDAECIRDAMLTASDQLDPKPPVGSAVAVAGEGPIGSTGGFIRINEDTFQNATANYRSVYLPVVRDLLPDALAVFDHPDSSHVCGAREVTNVPAQALYLLNNEFVAAQARKFADRLLAMPSATTNQRIERAYVVAFGRRPTKNEATAAATYLTRNRETKDAWGKFCLALFATAEFRYLD